MKELITALKNIKEKKCSLLLNIYFMQFSLSPVQTISVLYIRKVESGIREILFYVTFFEFYMFCFLTSKKCWQVGFSGNCLSRFYTPS